MSKQRLTVLADNKQPLVRIECLESLKSIYPIDYRLMPIERLSQLAIDLESALPTGHAGDFIQKIIWHMTLPSQKSIGLF